MLPLWMSHLPHINSNRSSTFEWVRCRSWWENNLQSRAKRIRRWQKLEAPETALLTLFTSSCFALRALFRGFCANDCKSLCTQKIFIQHIRSGNFLNYISAMCSFCMTFISCVLCRQRVCRNVPTEKRHVMAGRVQSPEQETVSKLIHLQCRLQVLVKQSDFSPTAMPISWSSRKIPFYHMTKVEKVTEGYDDAFQIHAYYDCTDIHVCAYLAGEGSREKKKCIHTTMICGRKRLENGIR